MERAPLDDLHNATPLSLEPLDIRLLHRLSEGCEPELVAVAHDLELDPEEARRRYLALRSRGVIRDLAARVDPATLGLPVTGFIMLRVAQNVANVGAMRDMIRDIEEVEEAHAVSGAYDWLVKVRSSSLHALQTLISERLSLIPGFIRAESHIVLETPCDYLNVDAAFHL